MHILATDLNVNVSYLQESHKAIASGAKKAIDKTGRARQMKKYSN